LTQVLFGNANNPASGSAGWFVGHFIHPPDDPRATKDVEIKWHTHPAGDSKPSWTKSTAATSLAILISGRFKFSFPDQNVLLRKQGDYVLWTPGVFHIWQAEEESIILTIRWPSKFGDVVSGTKEQ
jgi:quercetin dioxygenase-like cupin family protein